MAPKNILPFLFNPIITTANWKFIFDAFRENLGIIQLQIWVHSLHLTKQKQRQLSVDLWLLSQSESISSPGQSLAQEHEKKKLEPAWFLHNRQCKSPRFARSVRTTLSSNLCHTWLSSSFDRYAFNFSFTLIQQSASYYPRQSVVDHGAQCQYSGEHFTRSKISSNTIREDVLAKILF